jgi:RNA polymerase subunit RPABC4/transcription elongation factor Spt4
MDEAQSPSEPAEKTCKHCGAVVSKGSKFCQSCGKAVRGECIRCGSVLGDEDKFCPSCGADVTGRVPENTSGKGTGQDRHLTLSGRSVRIANNGEDSMKNRFILWILVLALWLFLSPFVWSGQTSDKDTFTMALTGDSIITRRLSVYNEPSFLQMIELIRSADVAFTNLEMLFHDYEPYPMHQSGGTYMRADPALAKELAWAGFDMVSRANNHAGDYGVEGMRLTTKYTEAAGLVHAGVGESLPEAREAFKKKEIA